MEVNSELRNSVDAEEIARFSAIADQWWDERGKFAPLHRINPLRIQWVIDQIVARHSNREIMELSLIDIGCGGGLMAEPMARAGLKVTAIDASERNIAVARMHAEQSGLTIDYRCATAEALAEQDETFDVVMALEIIEHVANPEEFVASCAKLAKPGGLVVFSTLNRTPKSYALAIVGAEYVLRWLPRGTHDWNKFIRPHELVRWAEDAKLANCRMEGMVFKPLSNRWVWDQRDLSVNYILAADAPGN